MTQGREMLSSNSGVSLPRYAVVPTTYSDLIVLLSSTVYSYRYSLCTCPYHAYKRFSKRIFNSAVLANLVSPPNFAEWFLPNFNSLIGKRTRSNDLVRSRRIHILGLQWVQVIDPAHLVTLRHRFSAVSTARDPCYHLNQQNFPDCTSALPTRSLFSAALSINRRHGFSFTHRVFARF
jgi:hypothetical protein